MLRVRDGLWLGLLLGCLVGCEPAMDTQVSDLSELDVVNKKSDPDSSDFTTALAGRIEIDGSSTVYPVSEAVANEFRKSFPEVNVTVAVSGTGGGFKRFSKGETDISDASRPIKQSELEQCQVAGVTFVELPIAYDGLTIVVNRKNTWVAELTVQELQKIFHEEGAADNWSDVNPEWPAEKIKIYAPGADSGTFDYFKEVVAEGGSLRSDMSVSEDDNVLVTGVANERNAIGFFGAAYFFENKEKLKAVPIVNPETKEAVLPTPESIESGAYAPFSRPLFIYVNTASIKRPEIKKFVNFYLEQAGNLAKSTGYVALPAELYERAQTHFKDRLSGTHYVTADGAKRSGALPDVYQPQNLLK